MITRRTLLAAAAATTAAPLVDTHIHLFDPAVFPYHPQATYQPPAAPLAPYVKEALGYGLTHSIIVHPEPYQDDHRYLEYCFAHEPRPGFFKGTCLFDALRQDTPARMAALVKKWPGRIVALRIHATTRQPQLTGPIRERPLDHPLMKATWAAAGALGLAIQMHTIPAHAPAIRKLAEAHPRVPVVIDHLARRAQGTEAEYEEVLRLAQLPQLYMKFSGLSYSSKQPPPHADLAPAIGRMVRAFTPDRVIWGGLGMTAAEYRAQRMAFDHLLAFASEVDRAKIRGANAVKLYRLS
jgi:predicted TIM-barrel fold metal-dependent hydrolase